MSNVVQDLIEQTVWKGMWKMYISKTRNTNYYLLKKILNAFNCFETSITEGTNVLTNKCVSCWFEIENKTNFEYNSPPSVDYLRLCLQEHPDFIESAILSCRVVLRGKVDKNPEVVCCI